jgi:hypothetical protein
MAAASIAAAIKPAGVVRTIALTDTALPIAEDRMRSKYTPILKPAGFTSQIAGAPEVIFDLIQRATSQNLDVRCNTGTFLSSAGIRQPLQLSFVQSSYSCAAGHAGYGRGAPGAAIPAPLSGPSAPSSLMRNGMLFSTIDPLIATGVVLATAATDAVYVMFTSAVVARHRLSAATWS